MAAYQGQKVDRLDTMCRGGEGWLGRVWNVDGLLRAWQPIPAGL